MIIIADRDVIRNSFELRNRIFNGDTELWAMPKRPGFCIIIQ